MTYIEYMNQLWRSALLSKRATRKAPRLCTYIESTLNNERQNRPKPIRAVYNTPHEAFPLNTDKPVGSENSSLPTGFLLDI